MFLLATAIDARLNRHRDVILNPLAYAAGVMSIDDAYVMQGSWSYHKPWGAIIRALAPHMRVGPHTPIWSFISKAIACCPTAAWKVTCHST